MAMAPHIEMNKSTSVEKEEDEEQSTQIKTPQSIVHSRYVWPEKKKRQKKNELKSKKIFSRLQMFIFFSSSSS